MLSLWLRLDQAFGQAAIFLLGLTQGSSTLVWVNFPSRSWFSWPFKLTFICRSVRYTHSIIIIFFSISFYFLQVGSPVYQGSKTLLSLRLSANPIHSLQISHNHYFYLWRLILSTVIYKSYAHVHTHNIHVCIRTHVCIVGAFYTVIEWMDT